MATKKSSPKKATTKKVTAKATPKKAPAKKRAAAKRTTASSEFMSFSPTRESLYWLVLGTVVILFAIWILRLQSDIQSIYDQIEMTQVESDIAPLTPATSKKD